MKKLMILSLVLLAGVVPIMAQSNIYDSAPLTPYEGRIRDGLNNVDLNMFYHVSEIPIDLIKADGTTEEKNIRIRIR